MDYESETEFGYEGGNEDTYVGGGATGYMVVAILSVVIFYAILIIVATYVSGGEMSVTWARQFAESEEVTKLRDDSALALSAAVEAQKAAEAAAAGTGTADQLSAVWKNRERLSSNSGYHNKSQYAGLERTCGARNNA